MAKLIRKSEMKIYATRNYECGSWGLRDSYGNPLVCSNCKYDYTIISNKYGEKEFIKEMKYCMNCGEKLE